LTEEFTIQRPELLTMPMT